jgi:hypothetical protein
MSRDEARARLRELLGPLRERAVAVFEVPDIQDALSVLSVSWNAELFGDEADEDMKRLVAEARFDPLTPLGYVFQEEA